MAAAARQAGVTILELVLVLVLLGALGTIAVNRAPGSLLTSAPSVRQGQDQLIGDLRSARDLALGCGGDDTRMVVSLNPESYTLDAGNAYGVSACAEGEIQREPPGGVTISPPDPNAFALTYPEARVTDPDDTTELGDLSITLSAEDTTRHVCIRGRTGSIQRGPC